MYKLFILFSISFSIASCYNSDSGKTKQDAAATAIKTIKEEVAAQPGEPLKETFIGINKDTLHATFNNEEESAEFTFKGQQFKLPQQRTASGLRFADATYEFVLWHQEVRLTKNGKVIFTNVPKK